MTRWFPKMPSLLSSLYSSLGCASPAGGFFPAGGKPGLGRTGGLFVCIKNTWDPSLDNNRGIGQGGMRWRKY